MNLSDLNQLTVTENILATVIASVIIFFSTNLINGWKDKRDSKKIYDWLVDNSDLKKGGSTTWRTGEIASSTNLPPKRVEHLCHHHKGVHLVANSKYVEWSIHYKTRPGFFDIDWE